MLGPGTHVDVTLTCTTQEKQTKLTPLMETTLHNGERIMFPFRKGPGNETKSPGVWAGLQTPQIPIQLSIHGMEWNHGWNTVPISQCPSARYHRKPSNPDEFHHCVTWHWGSAGNGCSHETSKDGDSSRLPDPASGFSWAIVQSVCTIIRLERWGKVDLKEKGIVLTIVYSHRERKQVSNPSRTNSTSAGAIKDRENTPHFSTLLQLKNTNK